MLKYISILNSLQNLHIQWKHGWRHKCYYSNAFLFLSIKSKIWIFTQYENYTYPRIMYVAGILISKGLIFRRRVSTGAMHTIKLMVIFLFYNKTTCQYLVYKFTFCFTKKRRLHWSQWVILWFNPYCLPVQRVDDKRRAIGNVIYGYLISFPYPVRILHMLLCFLPCYRYESLYCLRKYCLINESFNYVPVVLYWICITIIFF